MRTSKEKAQANRDRILASASKLFSERGFDGVGVDAIMESAGLTHGGFYKHFKSKSALAVEALDAALTKTLCGQKHLTDLDTYISDYLSDERRGEPSLGCAITTMGPDAARREELRRPIGDNVRGQIEAIVDLIETGDAARKREKALRLLSTMVGAMVLSRAVDDEMLSDELIAAAKGSSCDC